MTVERNEHSQPFRHDDDHPLTAGEPFTNMSIGYVVVEVVKQAESDGLEGTIRAKPQPPAAPLA